MLGTIHRALRRAPEAKQSATHSLIALSTPGQPVWTPRDYSRLAREAYAANPVAHRCVRLIAEAAASLNFTVRRGEDKAAADDPATGLLHAPNPEQSGAELFETLYGYLLTAGNAYLEAAELDGAVRELYVLRPDRMRVVAGARGWPDGFEYSTGGRSMRFPRDPASGRCAVLQLKTFHPTNDHYGLSPLEAAARAVDIHNAGAGWTKALLDNAARPSGALVYNAGDGRLTDEQFERLKAELAEAHQGAANAGRPMVLDGGLDWKPLSLTPADMEFLEARREAAREIALAFGVPPMLLGIPGDNTYANYREANLAFWRQTVIPLARKTAAALTLWLTPWLGRDLTICACEEHAPALATERAAEWKRVSEANFLSEDEKRAALGLPKTPAGS